MQHFSYLGCSLSSPKCKYFARKKNSKRVYELKTIKVVKRKTVPEMEMTKKGFQNLTLFSFSHVCQKDLLIEKVMKYMEVGEILLAEESKHWDRFLSKKNILLANG